MRQQVKDNIKAWLLSMWFVGTVVLYWAYSDAKKAAVDCKTATELNEDFKHHYLTDCSKNLQKSNDSLMQVRADLLGMLRWLKNNEPEAHQKLIDNFNTKTKQYEGN